MPKLRARDAPETINSTCRFCLSKRCPRNLIKLDDIIQLEYEFLLSTSPPQSDQYQFVCRRCREDLQAAFSFKNRVLESEKILFMRIQTPTVDPPEVKQKVNAILSQFALETDIDEEMAKKPCCEVTCPDCGKVTRNLARHSLVHRRKKPPPEETNTCHICHRDFVNLSEHVVKRHQRTMTCSICDKLVKSRLYGIHMLTHRNPPVYSEEEKRQFQRFYCELCNKFVQKLSAHKRITHESSGWICEECGEGPMMTVKYYEHKRIHLKGKLICDLCDKEFTLKTQLKKHMANRHMTKLIECANCGKKFGTEDGVRKHVEKVHVEAKVRCSVAGCEGVFKTVFIMRNHVRSVHEKAINLPCETCGAVFHSWGSLKHHNRTGHDYVNKCWCGLECFSKAKFIQHQYSDHFENERFKCYCGAFLKGFNVYSKHLETIHQIPYSERSKARIARAMGITGAQKGENDAYSLIVLEAIEEWDG